MGSKVVVPADAVGFIVCEYSDTRLSVAFPTPGGDGPCPLLNVMPTELKPFVVPELPTGKVVQATEDIWCGDSVIPKGTRGVVLAPVDGSQVRISFESEAQNADAT